MKRSSSPKATLPAVIPLSQPTLVAAPPSGPGWVHEVKLDGYRIAARVHRSEVRLMTRAENDWTANATGVVEALRSLDLEGTVLDGEVLLFHPDGSSDFQGLRSVKSHRREGAVIYVVFDLLFAHGRDLRSAPLLERKMALHQLLAHPGVGTHVRPSELFEGSGAAVYRGAAGLGLEGIVSKRGVSPYRAGRTRDWVKCKNPAYRRR